MRASGVGGRRRLWRCQDVVLFRGQPDDKRLSVDDGRLLVLQLLEFYVNDDAKYALVQTFNHRPSEFSMDAVLAAVDVQTP